MSQLGANRDSPGGVHSEQTRTNLGSDPSSGSGYDVTQDPSTAFGSSSGSGFHRDEAGVHDAGATIPESVADFTSFLTQSGLMTPEEVEKFQHDRSTDNNCHDAHTLADALVEERRITSYQATVLLQGQTRGLVLGNYVVLEKLGEGGMGMVFKARHRRMKREVALKVLPPALVGSPAVINRFHREVEAAAKLTHPNIAQAFDADEADGIHFLVMEHVDGPNLSAYVKQCGPIPVGAAVHIMAQAARGLAPAHQQGVVHRDIKPGNLMVNKHGQVKVLDMGLAQLKVEEDAEEAPKTELTQSGRVMGTVDYMAPEQALDAKRVDHRADIYSLGCTLFYLLAGRGLSPDGSMTQKLLWHQNQPVPPLSEVCPGIPDKVNDVFQKMVAKKPEDRQASMAEVLGELEACLAELPDGEMELVDAGIELSASAPSTDHSLRMRRATLVERPTRTDYGEPLLQPARGKKGWLAALAVLLVAGVAGGAVLAVMNKKAPEGSQNTAEAAAGTVAVVPDNAEAEPKTSETPAPPPLPHEEFLRWVFESGGAVSVVADDGSNSVEAGSLAALPAVHFNIRGIRLDRTAVQDEDLARLAEVPMLERLSLAQTGITDEGLEHVAQLERLTSLNLAETEITNAGLEHLQRMAQLRELNLQKTAVTDQGMARLLNLSSLEKLYLADTQVGDPGVAQLAQLRALKYISLNGTYVTDEGYDSLVAAVPNLNIVWDGRDRERGVAHKLLDLGAHLSLVTRDGREMQDVARRQDLPRQRFTLTSVDLSDNPQVSDADLELLAGLVGIESLYLGGTGITSQGLFNLHGLATLHLLDFGRLQLTEASLSELSRRLPDCEIQIAPSSDREVALWVFEQQGKVTIVNREGHESADLVRADQLPQGPFVLREVHLDGNPELDDEALTRFSDLPGLETLFIAGSGVTDAGLVHLSGCTLLRQLSLSDTSVGSAGLAQLARFRSLERLYLANTNVDGEGLRHLIALPELTHLSVAGTQLVDADMTHLKGIQKLTWLDLTGLPITDAALPHLRRLQHVAELRVEGTQISDAGIEQLTTALAPCQVVHDPLSGQRLAARWVLEKGGAVTLESGEIVRLTDLPPDDCTVLAINLDQIERLSSDEVASQIARCPQLRELRLTKTGIDDSALAPLANLGELERLYVAQTNVTDNGLDHLAGCTKLILLDVRATRVTGSGLARLSELTQLEHLLLGQCRLSNRNLAAIAAFSSLRSLDLSSSAEVTDTGLAPLAGLTHLELLWLRGTRVTDGIGEQLAGYAALTDLDLSGTSVTDAVLENLVDLENLRSLNLNSTDITDSGLSTLGQMTQLTRLYVVTKDLSESALDSLEAALPDCSIAKPATTRREDQESGGGGQGFFGGS